MKTKTSLRPNVEGLGLENAGVKLNDRESIWDDDTQTNISNIYVAGDVTTEMALVNVGEREARHACGKNVWTNY